MRPKVRWACLTLFVSSLFANAISLAAQEKPKIEIVPRLGHTQDVTSVAFSPDGARIVSGSHDHTAILWDIASGLPIRTFSGHAANINSVTYSPDGKTILSGGDDMTIRMWDVTTGQLIREFTGHTEPVTSIAISPDGTLLLSGAGRGGLGSKDVALRLWDVATGRVVRTFNGHSDRVNSVSFSPDGKRILSASGNAGGCNGGSCSRDHTVRLWDTATGQLIRALSGHRDAVYAATFSPDGLRAVSSSQDRTIKLWDLSDGRLLRSLERTPGDVPKRSIDTSNLPADLAAAVKAAGDMPSPTFAAITPDGKGVVSVSLDEIGVRVWDIETGRMTKYVADEDAVSTGFIVFSPSRTLLLTGSLDNQNTMKLWDSRTYALVRTLRGASYRVDAIGLSPDGTRMATGSTLAPMMLWDTASGRMIRSFGDDSNATSLAFSPDGKSILTGHNDFERWGGKPPRKTVRQWNAGTGALIREYDAMSVTSSSVAFSPDGTQVVASGGMEKTIKVWDTSNGQLLRTITIDQVSVEQIAFSPDGRLLASGSAASADAKLWDITTGKLVRTLGQVTAKTVAFSPDGSRLLTGGRHLSMWDVRTGRTIHVFKNIEYVGPVAFSPDGRLIVTSGNDPHPPGQVRPSLTKTLTIRIYDAVSGDLVRKLEGHTDSVVSLAFTPDSKRVVSGSEDTTIRIWDIGSGDLISRSIGDGVGGWLTITPEGFFDSSDKGTQLLGAVRGLEAYSIDQFYQSLYRPDVVRQKLSMDTEIRSRAADAGRKLNLEIILASKAPPSITIASPQNESQTGDTNVTVEATLAEAGGGIGRIEWRVNGVTRGVQDLQRAPGGGDTKVTRTLALADGTSVIEMVAYNKANLAASLPMAVTVTATSSTPRPPPRLHVLTIGLNKYRHADLDLKFAAADARAIAAAFQLGNSGAGLYERIEVHGPLLDEEVTAENIRREFERLGKIVRPDDVLVLYLAGHGVTEDGRYYFLPHNVDGKNIDTIVATSIGQDQLQDWLTQIPALRSVLIYDTCEAGSNTEDRFRTTQQLVAAEKLSRSMGRTVLSATSDVTNALDGYQGHGIFTYVLLDAFAHADRNNDGRIETDELADYLRTKLPELSEKQTKFRQEPQVKLIGSPFALVNRANIADINRVRQ